jgi:hypothetical protein
MIDRVIFDHQGVTVSYNHLYVNQTLFSIENITLVEQRMLKPKYVVARLFMFGGLPFIFATAWYPLIGLTLILIGLILFKLARIRYALVIHTAEKTFKLLFKEDNLDIEYIVSAINVALCMKAGARSLE